MERRSATDSGEFRRYAAESSVKPKPKVPKHHALFQERAATTMTTHANIYPTFTIKDLAKALGSVRNTGAACANACRHVHMGAWSSGMIRASGARGRGFDSRSSPSSHTRAKPQRRRSRCSTSASRTRRPRRAASTTAGRSRRTARSSSAGRRTSTARPRATTSRASPSPARSARPSRRATSRSTTST